MSRRDWPGEIACWLVVFVVRVGGDSGDGTSDAEKNEETIASCAPVTIVTRQSAEASECAGIPGTHDAIGTVGNVQSGGITCAVDPASK